MFLHAVRNSFKNIIFCNLNIDSFFIFLVQSLFVVMSPTTKWPKAVLKLLLGCLWQNRICFFLFSPLKNVPAQCLPNMDTCNMIGSKLTMATWTRAGKFQFKIRYQEMLAVWNFCIKKLKIIIIINNIINNMSEICSISQPMSVNL